MVVHITGGGHFELCAYRPLGGYPILFAVFFENSIPICNTMQNYKNLSPSAQSFWIPSQLYQTRERASPSSPDIYGNVMIQIMPILGDFLWVRYDES